MEGDEKPDLRKDCSSVTSLMGSEPSETALQLAATALTLKQQDNHMSSSSFSTASKISCGQGVELASIKASPALDAQQAIPPAVPVLSGLSLPGVTCALEGSSSLQPVPLVAAGGMLPPSTISVSEGSCAVATSSTDAPSIYVLPPKNNSRLEDSSAVQAAPSAAAPSSVLPCSMTLMSDESHAHQLSPTAVAVSAPAFPSTTSAAESESLVSDQGEKPLKKEKVRKRPRQLLQDARARDVNKSSEKQPVIRWKDIWVAQLIHIRGRMHSTFTSPQRQRVDLWQIVKHEMTNSCYGFDKDSEACRKKWIRVYKEYKDDLHLSSDEKAQKCRFYDLVDFYMGDRANGLCSMPLRPERIPVCPDPMHTAKDMMVTPLSNEVDVKVKDDGAMVPPHESPDVHTTKPSSISKKPPLAKRPRVVEKLPSLDKPPPLLEAPVAATSKKPHMKNSVQTMLSELVNIGKEMLQTTREFEREKIAVLHSIKDTLGKIAKKI
eukprot:c18955_g1_i1 orf=358-1833(-)